MNHPEKSEYAVFYETYVSLVSETDIVSALENQVAEVKALFAEIPEEKGSFAYAEGKWNIRQLLGHIIDGERVFSYRALRISRGDQTPLAGFEENFYVDNSNFNERKIVDLIEEFSLLRRANVVFFTNLNDEMWRRTGTASENKIPSALWLTFRSDTFAITRKFCAKDISSNEIWLSKNSEIPIREQITAQIRLGIISGDLSAGERIPTTREIAGRFQIHANTVASAYQKLLEKGLIEFRKGSGFYVREFKNENNDGQPQLDLLIKDFFRHAQSCGFSRDEIKEYLRKLFAARAPRTICVIEPDEDLRAILIEEIRAATNFQLIGVSPTEFRDKYLENDVIAAVMANKKAALITFLPNEKMCVSLIANSVSNSMKDQTRPAANEMIAVVSGWNNFLILSKTVLVAANIEVDSIILRSTKDANWRKGLKNASMIICDSLTAKKFGDERKVRQFRIISDQSLQELAEIMFVN